MTRTKKFFKPTTITFNCESLLKEQLKILAKQEGIFDLSSYLVKELMLHVKRNKNFLSDYNFDDLKPKGEKDDTVILKFSQNRFDNLSEFDKSRFKETIKNLSI